MSDINITISGKKRLLTAGKYCDKNIVITPVGGGDFSGEYVIPVDELPTDNIDTNAVYLCGGAYYKYASEFTDIWRVHDGGSQSAVALFRNDYGIECYLYIIPTKNTDGVIVSDSAYHLYYVEDEDDIFLYGGAENGWLALGTAMEWTYRGVITDTSEATENGYYAVMTRGWTKYLAPTGTLEITESGTYDVSEYASAEVNVQGGAVQEYDGTIIIS